jgi:hypothetical protein
MGHNFFAPPRSNVELRREGVTPADMPFRKLRNLCNASQSIFALGFLHALGALGLIGIGTRWVFSPMPGASADAPYILIAIGLVLAVACVTSFTRPVWGRWLGAALCIPGLAAFPIGTIIAMAALVAYAQGAKLFGPARFLHRDVVRAYKERKRSEG